MTQRLYLMQDNLRLKFIMRGINHADEADVSHEKRILTFSNLLVESTKDYATRADLQEQRRKEWT